MALSGLMLQAVRNGGTTVSVSAGSSYDTDAQAYFTAMSVQPTIAEKDAVNTFIVNCKANGSWAKAKGWAIPGLSNGELVNMKDPTESFGQTGIVHTPNVGMKNSPKANASGIKLPGAKTLSSYSLVYTDMHVSVGIKTFEFEAFGAIIANVGGLWCLGQDGSGTSFNYHAGGSVFAASPVLSSPTKTDFQGRWIIERTGANLRRCYKNGTSVSNDTNGTTGSGSVLRWIGGDSGTSGGGSYMDAPDPLTTINWIGFGLSMDTTIAAAFDTELATLLSVVTP